MTPTQGGDNERTFQHDGRSWCFWILKYIMFPIFKLSLETILPTGLTPGVAGLERNVSKLSWDSSSDSPGSCFPAERRLGKGQLGERVSQSASFRPAATTRGNDGPITSAESRNVPSRVLCEPQLGAVGSWSGGHSQLKQGTRPDWRQLGLSAATSSRAVYVPSPAKLTLASALHTLNDWILRC